MLVQASTDFTSFVIQINNAGWYQPQEVKGDTAEDISTIMGTNFESAYHLSQLAYPLLKASGSGNMVFISSIAVLKSLPLTSVQEHPRVCFFSSYHYLSLLYKKEETDTSSGLKLQSTTIILCITWLLHQFYNYNFALKLLYFYTFICNFVNYSIITIII